MIFERDGDSILLEAPHTRKDDAKSIPGARWDKKARRWRYPLSWGVCIVARGVFGGELEVGPELSAWSRNELETRVRPALAAREKFVGGANAAVSVSAGRG